jgi:hypothetical protein
MTGQKTKIPANERTQDPPSAPDLTALITDHANVTVSALRRAMFDSHAPSATRIAAARAILDATLRMREIEDRTAPSPANQRFYENLKQRIKEFRERLAETEEEQGQKQKSKIPANESTQVPPSAPDLTVLIPDHANAALSV